MKEQRFIEILNNISKIKNIAVIGDVGIDKYTFGVVERISPEAPVPVLEVSKQWTKLGLAANVSDNLIGLKAKTTLCGVIGNDNHADQFEELLEQRNLSTWGIVRSDERTTTFKERIVADTQQICRIDYESKKQVDQKSRAFLFDRIKELSSEFDAVIIEDYAKGLVNEEFAQNIIELFKSKGKPVIVDPSRYNPISWYRGATLIKPNLKEAKLLVKEFSKNTQWETPDLCQSFIDNLGIEQVVITLGESGMGLMKKGESYGHIPTKAKSVYDVSGAGDTCVALLTIGLLCGASLEEAAWIANLGAGVVVGKKGTATVTKEELIQYFHES
jgi:rfaE bifunctional protein kinase chain/domain